MSDKAPELAFQVSVAEGKYTYRSFKDGSSDMLRYGVLWSARDVTGDKAMFCFAYELHALQQNKPTQAAPPQIASPSPASEPLTAHQFMQEFMKGVSLPRQDAKTYALVPVERVRELITLAVQADRTAGVAMNFEAIAAQVIPGSDTGVDVGADSVLVRRATLVHTLRYAQACGARFKPGNPTEDDYTECVTEACEAFMASMKNRGFMS